MDKLREHQYLQVPEQTLSTLSFCEPTARHLNNWVSGLPMANIGETARQLYHAAIEFNQLRLTEQSRFELLELVRNPIHYVCNALNRRYLTQSIVLGDNQRKIANLAQALQTHLATGYKIIIKNRLVESQPKSKELLARSIHRCLSDLAPNILRSYQLYLRTPPGIWQEIHGLYQIADSYELNDFRFPDQQNVGDDALSIQELYQRLLLLGSCQPNQLHQRDLTEIYGVLELWAGKVSIDEVADDSSTLIVNPHADTGPMYRHLLKPQSYSDFMGLDTASLVRALHQSLVPPQQGVAAPESSLVIPPSIGSGLVQHLVQSWGGMKQRTFSRNQTDGSVAVALGLTSVHFRLSNGVGFYRQLYNSNIKGIQNPFMVAAVAQFDSKDTNADRDRAKQDVWDKSFDAGHNLIPDVPGMEADIPDFEEEDQKESHPQYSAALINTSPRGYCLGWKGELASTMQTGEIVAIRESGNDRWNLGVIRWIRQAAKEVTQLGVELIAPNSQPCAVRLLNKTGAHGDYMRGLMVPEIRSIAQPASILVPRVPFQVGHKVGISYQGEEDKFQLIKKIQGASSFNQFQIRTHDTKKTADKDVKNKNPDEGFESLWRQL